MVTNQEVEAIKGHFDKVAHEFRNELSAEFRGEFALVRSEAAANAQELRAEIAGVQSHADAVAQATRSELRAEIAGVQSHADAVAQETRSELRAEIAGVRSHADAVAQETRSEMREGFAKVRSEIGEFRLDAAAVADHLKQEIAEVRHYTGAVAEDLRSDIRAVAEGVALANARLEDVDLRVDGLTSEVRRGFAGVRAEIHRLHETDDELRRRIEAPEQRGA